MKHSDVQRGIEPVYQAICYWPLAIARNSPGFMGRSGLRGGEEHKARLSRRVRRPGGERTADRARRPPDCF
jgi:hypothetical protein